MADAHSSTTIKEEFAKLLGEVRTHWLQPVTTPLPRRQRFIYACTGSATWVIVITQGRFVSFLEYTLSLNPVFEIADLELLWPLIPLIWIPLLIFTIPLWFGWLVSWRERPVGPIRLYLEGILLPTAVILILRVCRPDIIGGD